LRSLDRDVVYLSSFSKTFASGLRVGWALVPPAVRDRLVLTAESATFCPPSFTQMLVSRYLAAHDWRSQVKTYTEAYRERRDAMLHALESYLPEGCTWNVRDGGFSVWLAVPGGVDTKALLPRAVTARVAYASGTRVLRRRSRESSAAAVVLLPVAGADHGRGPALGPVLEAELDVLHTFGSPARPAIGRGPQAPSPHTP
jgi:DNA-binding transcriptional MocR family regulator